MFTWLEKRQHHRGNTVGGSVNMKSPPVVVVVGVTAVAPCVAAPMSMAVTPPVALIHREHAAGVVLPLGLMVCPFSWQHSHLECHTEAEKEYDDQAQCLERATRQDCERTLGLVHDSTACASGSRCGV